MRLLVLVSDAQLLKLRLLLWLLHHLLWLLLNLGCRLRHLVLMLDMLITVYLSLLMRQEGLLELIEELVCTLLTSHNKGL
jgi:hypothetical protein